MDQPAPHVPDPDAMARPMGDPVGEILHLLRLTGTFYCQSRLTAPWGIAVPPFPGLLSFLVVTEGQCWLTVDGHDPIFVRQGTLVLITGSRAARVQSECDVPADPLEALPIRQLTEIYETLDHGGGGALTTMMYGLVRIDHAAAGLLTDLLPDVLTVDSWTAESGAWLQSTLHFIAREARDLRPGGEAVLTRLADVLVIEAIRQWIGTAPDADCGWLSGARDQQIGRAIMAIHRAPSQRWTVDDLSRVAGMSRSSFAARFTLLVGVSAMKYLTTWRMHLARAQLVQTARPIVQIAGDLGYDSETAFSRAFRRMFGVPPGQVRRAGMVHP